MSVWKAIYTRCMESRFIKNFKSAWIILRNELFLKCKDWITAFQGWVSGLISGQYQHYAECVHQDVRMPDERAGFGGGGGAARGEGVYIGGVRGGGGRDFAEHVQRKGRGGAKGDREDAKPGGGGAEKSAGGGFGFHGLHGAE